MRSLLMCHTPAKSWVKGHGFMDGLWTKLIIQPTQLLDWVWQYIIFILVYKEHILCIFKSSLGLRLLVRICWLFKYHTTHFGPLLDYPMNV